MVSDGQQDWVELYRGALMELDRAKLPQKIEAANAAIQQRINQLLTSKDGHQEYSALEDALRNLRSFRRQTE
jgi:predicted Fe-Mo cluster-binding NifX family protein